MVCTMSTVADIENAVASLDPDGFARFERWFVAHRNRVWDRQLDEDAAAGRLDSLFAEAETEMVSEELSEWPGPEA